MKKLKSLVMPVLASVLAVSVSYALAADQVPTQEKNQTNQQMSGKQSERMSQGQGMGGGGAQKNAMPSFTSFDLNNDGKISEDEFTEARTARISERAQEGRQMKGLADAASFADIDTNNDGSISPEEFSVSLDLHRQKKGQ